MAGATVLLVDDESELVSALSKRLEIRGLRVTIASNGDEAVAICRRERFDAVVLDLLMPGMDGMETLTQLKEIHPDGEVIVLSGQLLPETGIEGMKRGAMECLSKPADFEVLLERILEAAEGAAASDTPAPPGATPGE
jgi:DNA-binding NtrC family response regulator